MQYPTLPPELNSLRILSGAGSGPMLQAAQAWQSLGSSLRQASSSFGNVTSNLTNGAWQGAASQAMAQAAAPYIAWLTAAATHSETAAMQSQLVASAFEAARSMTVPLHSISSNRNAFRPADQGEPLWTAHPGDHGHRGPLRRNVGPGRGGDRGLPLGRLVVRGGVGAPVAADADPARNAGRDGRHGGWRRGTHGRGERFQGVGAAGLGRSRDGRGSRRRGGGGSALASGAAAGAAAPASSMAASSAAPADAAAAPAAATPGPPRTRAGYGGTRGTGGTRDRECFPG